MPSFTENDIPSLRGQVIIVTGGNVGLGLETVRQLSKHDPARIYLAARSQDKAGEAIQQLKQSNHNVDNIVFLELDLASLDSVKTAARTFLQQERRLDILINNAGVMMIPEGLTKDGYEIQFGTNVIGPALFTQLLLPVLRKTAKINTQTRMVMLSSAAHARAPDNIYNFSEFHTMMGGRSTIQRYTISKLADLHYARALAERETEVKIIATHPGMVATNLHHGSKGFLSVFLSVAIGLFATPVEKGALSQIYASVSPEAKSGLYYGPVGKVESGSRLSQDRTLQEDLFNYVQNEIATHVTESK